MEQLTQLLNQLEIVGVLKEKNLEKRISSSGEKYITGYLTVRANINTEIHDFKINVFAMNRERSKNTYAGLRTILNDYKTIKSDGEFADTIKVRGSIKLKKFLSPNNEEIEYNEIKGIFFSRVPKQSVHKAFLEIGTIVERLLVRDNLIEIKGFNVAYNEEVVKLFHMYVDESIKEEIRQYYANGETGLLRCNLKCKSNEINVPHGFGSNLVLASGETIFSSLEMHIVGGEYPYTDERRYSDKMIRIAKQKLKAK